MARHSLITRASSTTRRQFLLGTAVSGAANSLRAFKSRIGKASIGAITDQIAKTQADAIDFARRYNLSCVELRNLPETGKEFALMTEPELKRAAAELLSNKLKVSFLNTSLMKFDWDADKKRWDRRKDDFTNALLAANILGADKIGIFTGARVANPQTSYKLIAQTMEIFIPQAEQAKVRLAIVNDSSQNTGTAAEAANLLSLLPSQTIGMNWNPATARELGEIAFPDAYARLPKSRILNIHFQASDFSDGPNKIPWKSILDALQKDNYPYKIGLDTQDDAASRADNANAAMDEMMHLAGRLD